MGWRIKRKSSRRHTWGVFTFSSHVSVQDGRAASAVAVCSFLCFCRLFTTAEAAVYMFSMKRCPPGIAPSHKRSDSRANSKASTPESRADTVLHGPDLCSWSLQVYRVYVWHDGRGAHHPAQQAHNNSLHRHDACATVQQAAQRVQAILRGLRGRRESPHHLTGVRQNEVSWPAHKQMPCGFACVSSSCCFQGF